MKQEGKKTYQDLEQEIKDLQRELDDVRGREARQKDMILFSESASDVAHEIRNPVSFVVTYVNVMKRNMRDLNKLISMYQALDNNDVEFNQKMNEIKSFENQIEVELTKTELNEAINSIELAFKRIEEIANRLSLLGKLNEYIPLDLNVNECINETLHMMNQKLGGQIEVKKELGNLQDIKSYKGKLSQVFTNLIKNSIEAIQEKEESRGNFLSIKTFQKEGKVVITLKDSGVGMTEETKMKLFQRFYTTKSLSKGTGLGMDVCKTIIEKHSGSIQVDSEIGKGTLLTIKLPIEH